MKMITVKLTEKEADLIWRNADGWLDAGACDGGLEPDERNALLNLCGQILKKIRPTSPRNTRNKQD